MVPLGMGILGRRGGGRGPAQRLRRAIDCLPETSREAMLRAIEQETIVTGAYSTRDGGVCPMLGAHRRGGRTDYAEFANAWDAFTGATDPRPATELEVLTLRKILAFARLADERAERARIEREAEQDRQAEEARRAAPPAVRSFRFRRRPRVQELQRTLRRIAAAG